MYLQKLTKRCFLYLLMMAHVFVSYAASSGEVHIYVFKDDGSVFEGMTVKSGRVTVKTDDSGMALLELPEGKQKVTLEHKGKTVSVMSVDIVADDITEAMLTVGTAKKAAAVNVLSEEEEKNKVDAKDLKIEKGDKFGFIQGKIVDVKKNKPVESARIFVRGLNAETKTNSEGVFDIKLPVGTYALSIIHPDYTSQNQDNVKVIEEKKTDLNIELIPSAIELDALQVVAVKIKGGVAELVEERKASSKVMDVIGAEQISKSGDSNAAAALKRVTGLTVVDGKFVYVRGMGERYSNALLNGKALPSPIIEKRVVPLDLFPTDVMESLVVQKTASADMPGEFGGGTVIIRTKKIPEERVIKLGVSLGYNSEVSLKNFKTHEGGSEDWTGYDDGGRKLGIPGRMGGPRVNSSNYNDETLKNIGKTWNKNWSTKEETAPLNMGVSAVYGDKFEFKGIPFGIYTNVSYGNSYKSKQKDFKSHKLAGGALVTNEKAKIDSTSYSVDLGSMFSIGTNLKDKHELDYTFIGIRTSEKKTDDYLGTDEGNDVRDITLTWLEQELINHSLKGSHQLTDWELKLDWGISLSEATRDEPDWRRVNYTLDTGVNKYLITDRTSNAMKSNAIDDNVDNYDFKLHVPFHFMNRDIDLNLGYQFIEKDRNSKTRRFQFNEVTSLPVSEQDQIADLIFSDANIDNGNWRIQETGRSTDNYKSTQEITSYFLMFDFPTLETLSLNIGNRFEDSSTKVSTFALFSVNNAAAVSKLDENESLPSFTLTYKPNSVQQHRLGYSKTLNRPDARELSTSEFDKVFGGGILKGNPNLKSAILDNFDYRWEYYFNEIDLFSVGLFYKSISNPIETKFNINSGGDYIEEYINAKDGELQGVEFEIKKNMDFLKNAWKDYYVLSNLTLIDSEVSVKTADIGVLTNASRPLRGQSPYVYNLTLGYDNPETEMNYALLYNVSGKRLTSAGSQGLPDTYEMPFDQLDFVFGKKFGKRYSTKLKIKNILNSEVEVKEGDQIRESYKKGMDISVGFGLSI